MSELGEPLSDRENDVLQCLITGTSNREIAQELDISHHTVKVHLRNIYSKLGVSSRTEATAVALQRGLVLLPGQETAVSGDGQLTATATTPVPPSPPSEQSSTTPTGPSWRSIGLAALALLAIGLIAFLILSSSGLALAPTVEPDSFIEEPLGDSQWRLSRSLPAPRAGMAQAAVGLKIYLIGGETADGVVDDVIVYQPETFTWEPAAPKLTAVSDADAAVLAGEIYVPGGRQADGRSTASVEVYSPANDGWRTVVDLPHPVAGGLAISDGSFLYLFGGSDGESELNTAYRYDPAGDRWETLPPMSHARAFAAGGIAAGQIYVVGGEAGGADLAICEQFDPLEGNWTDCPPLMQTRSRAGAVVLLNKLYIFGGSPGDGEVYNPQAGSWEPLALPMLTGDETWRRLGVSHIETNIYTVGGLRNGALVDDNYVYTPRVYQFFIPAASGSGQ